MKIKTLLLTVISAIFVLTANAQTFKSGKFYYEVVNAANRQVQIVAGPSAYTNVGTGDFPTTVTNDGKEYTVIGIGAGAFQTATLNGLCKLPEGYLYIDNGGFAGAIGASAGVRIPASMIIVSTTAFDSNHLGFLTVVADNKNYSQLSTTQDGTSYYFLCNKQQTAILAAPGERLKNIVGDVYNYVSNIVIPEQITEIGEYAFSGNTNLKTLTLHKGITKFGHAAFYGCKNLTGVTLLNPDAEYGDMLFCDCQGLTRAVLPAGIKSLPAHMFFCCVSLTNINLPEGIKELRKMCLSSTGLTSVNLPESLEWLDTCALQNTDIASVDLKNVKIIGNQCFSSCPNLASITGGEKVEEIGNAMLTNCPLIMQAPYFPNLKRMIGTPFFRMPGLTEFTVPASTEYIERNPVSCSPLLNEVKVEEGCAAFAELDSCLYEIKNDKPYRLLTCPVARENTELVLQPGTEIIGEQAIREVPLTALYGNAELKEIQVTGTKLNNTITKVKMLATVPPTGGTMFANETYANATLYVPKNSVDAYKAAEGWSNFQNIIGIDVVEPGIKGDVNGDGVVDIADLNILINAVLGQATVDTNVADINGDTIVDIADVNSLINIILGA